MKLPKEVKAHSLKKDTTKGLFTLRSFHLSQEKYPVFIANIIQFGLHSRLWEFRRRQSRKCQTFSRDNLLHKHQASFCFRQNRPRFEPSNQRIVPQKSQKLATLVHLSWKNMNILKTNEIAWCHFHHLSVRTLGMAGTAGAIPAPFPPGCSCSSGCGASASATMPWGCLLMWLPQ